MSVPQIAEERRRRHRRDSSGRRPEDRDVTHEALLALISKVSEQCAIDRENARRERDALYAELHRLQNRLDVLGRRVAWFGGGVAALVTALGFALRAGWLP